MNFCAEIVNEIRIQLEEVYSLRDKITMKSDGTYVSEGDVLVQNIVYERLKVILPFHQLISEEMAPFKEEWNEKGSYVVLDPIDGTENFVSGLIEWGVGISIYTEGKHVESCIYLPELDQVQITGMPIKKFTSRIRGLSSSLTKQDLEQLPEGFEYRIVGCSMYNMLSAIKGSFASFENVKAVACWDILPGLNLALEHGVGAFVDGEVYTGQILFPTKKYKILLQSA
ncbi:inositol monophosphatase family protein [Psychromonas aquatilis]|uniref:Inositol monophosphatase family protein n=1 Tax=Psychromonas aquatilis TaxID=2005072 RepID=A0ABU9GT69_9GAMM